MQAMLWGLVAAAVALAVLAGLAERRRIARRETHGIGWMPWPSITVFALFGAAICIALALNP